MRTDPNADTRCSWANMNPVMTAYHDTEWGVPLHDDLRLFELLVLEAMQAGLSWNVVLQKREHLRRAFRGFDPERVARFTARRVERLLADPGIIRNRLKIEATIHNARRFLETQDAEGSFDRYIWGFVDGRPLVHRFTRLRQIPATTRQSDAMSRDLRARGFKFVGSTVCYAFMQSAGMVNDHLVSCFRYRRVTRAAARPTK